MRGEFRQVLWEAGFDHKRHGVVEFFWTQLGIRCAFKCRYVGAVRDHHIGEAHAAWDKPFWFGVVLAVNTAHQFGHDVLVIPRGAECIFHHHPSFAEQDKVDIGRSGDTRWRREDGENRGVGVIKENGADGAIMAQVIFYRRIVSVPRHHIKGRVADVRFVKLATPFDDDPTCGIAISLGSRSMMPSSVQKRKRPSCGMTGSSLSAEKNYSSTMFSVAR